MTIDERKYDVSVILTLFNSRNFFKRALNSLMNQTYLNYELVIIDDGSNDNIEEEIFPLLKANNNYKYLRHSNRKHALSLNTGIAVSSGDLVTFIDSDDEYESKHIEERVNYFSNNPRIDLIHSPATIIGNENDFFVPDAKNINKMIHINDCVIGGTFFGKRKVFEELNGFRNIYSHDSDFFERASKKFNTARLESKTYIYHRDNSESVISKLKKEIYG